MYITKEKLAEIIKNAPSGTTPEGIMASLEKRGATIEGQREIKNKGAKGFLTGVLKGVASTVKGASELGERIIGAPTRLVTGEKFQSSAQKLQSAVEKKSGLKEGQLTTATTPAEKAGKFVEQVAEFAIPGSKISKATTLLPKATKLLTRAGTSAGVASLQEGKIGKGTLIAGTTEALLPGAGKLAKKVVSPATNVISRLFTGLGAGLSGVSTDTLKSIAKNPKVAQQVSKKIIAEGQESVLEANAKKILEGVSQIRQQARGNYGKGLEVLKSVDIKPEVIAKNTISSIKKNGIDILDDGVSFTNSEILDETIQNRAKGIINNINGQTTADGKTLRTLLDTIEASKFKSALEPNRMAYNNLMNDLSKGIKKSINESTDKLNQINKEFTTDMDLAEGVQKIFGKVKFKNTSELNTIAKKLETLFSQKGLDPQTVDKFLTRISVSPKDFKTSEAVRSVMTKTTGANTKGLSITEVIQQITSSVVTPNAVKNISIATGLAENVIKEMTKKLSPTVRATIIKSLLNK